MPISVDDLHAWIEAFADRVAEERQYLTKLDSAIGDGDHGQNLDRGLQAALERIEGATETGPLLKSVGMALVSKTGGASGPLYGTFFLDASKAAPDGGAPFDLDDWATMMQAGLDGVVRRGKAETGDKTMVDAMTPAVEALHNAEEAGDDLAAALAASAEAAREGMEATTPMVAQKGRASYLGERSKGHQDPGATSTYYLFAAAHDALSG
jgi:dihydroxyacetone kinase-like protein